MEYRTKKKGGAPTTKKSFKNCKYFKIEGTDETNISKCTCVNSNNYILFNTRLFKCILGNEKINKRGELRLKTEAEIIADEEDSGERNYLIKLLQLVKTHEESDTLIDKEKIDREFTIIYNKYANANLESNLGDNIDYIYDYIKSKYEAKNKPQNNNNQSTSFSNTRGSNVSIGTGSINNINTIEGMNSATKLRLETQRKIIRKKLDKKITKKKNPFYIINSKKIYDEINKTLTQLRTPKKKSMKLLFSNANNIIKGVKKLKDTIQDNWYKVIIDEIISNKKSNILTLDDLKIFFEFSERYDSDDLEKIKKLITRKFKSEWTKDKQKSKLNKFLENKDNFRILFLKDLEKTGRIELDKDMSKIMRGPVGNDEKHIQEISKLVKDIEAIGLLENIKLYEYINKIIKDHFLKITTWDKKGINGYRAKKIYEKQLKKWEYNSDNDKIIYDLIDIVTSTKNPPGQALVEITSRIDERIELYNKPSKLQEFNIDSSDVLLPDGWRKGSSSDLNRRYVCIRNSSVTSPILPIDEDKIDECSKSKESEARASIDNTGTISYVSNPISPSPSESQSASPISPSFGL